MALVTRFFTTTLESFHSNPVLKGSAVMFIASMVVNLSNFFYTAVMGRMLGPADYGVLTALTSLLYIVSVPSQSLNTVTVTFVSRFFALENRYAIWRLLRKAFMWLVVFSFLFLGSVILFRESAALYFNIPDSRLLVLLALLVATTFLNVLVMSVLQGLQRFHLYGLVVVIAAALKLGLGVVLVWLGYRVIGALLAFIGSMVLPLAFLTPTIRILRQETRVETTIKQKEVLRFALPTLVAFFGLALLINQDVVLVKKFFSPEEAGLYAALALIGKVIFFASGAVIAVVYPMVAAAHAAHGSIAGPLRLGVLLLSLICGGALVVYSLIPELVVLLLFGEAYVSIAPLVVHMGAFLSVYSFVYGLVMLLLALNQLYVVTVPLLFAGLQFFLLSRYHMSLMQVVDVSLGVSIFLLFSLLILYSARRAHIGSQNHGATL